MSLLAITPHTVEKLDGTHEQIEVALLSIKKLYLFAQKIADTDGVGLVTLATGKSEEWVDSLTPTSYGELHKKIIELNFPRAGEIAKGDPRLAALLMPFIQETQVLMVMAASAGMNLPGLSPAPAPSESKVDAASESSTSAPST
jgi:hypothetical protein